MNGQRLLPPGVFVALDAFGVLLVVLGALALTGTDFGRPVLIRAAPGLIAIGAALMVPMIVWIIRRTVALSGKP